MGSLYVGGRRVPVTVHYSSAGVSYRIGKEVSITPDGDVAWIGPRGGLNVLSRYTRGRRDVTRSVPWLKFLVDIGYGDDRFKVALSGALDQAKIRKVEQDRQNKIFRFESLADDLGIKLTKAQRRKLGLP